MCYVFMKFLVNESFQWWWYNYLIYLFCWSNKNVVAIHLQVFAFSQSLCTAGSSLTLSFARIFSLFKIISLTRLIAWSSSWCCLMLTVFNVCVDWWRTWSSCSFNKLLFIYTAQSHASLLHSYIFIPFVTAENTSFV